MEINNLKNENEIEINNNLENEINQKSFLETALGKTINAGLDIGIRALLPDFLEDQIINIKDNLFEYGLKDGIKKSIDDAIDTGKSIVGIFTGNFENINQMQEAIQSGGILDSISSLFDTVLNKLESNGKINNTVSNILYQGKDIILNNVEKNIQKTFNNQLDNFNNVENHINTWQKSFDNKDFDSMEKEYNKLKEVSESLAPLEKIINKLKEIDTIHNLIKNNGKNFDLNEQELELIKKLNN